MSLRWFLIFSLANLLLSTFCFSARYDVKVIESGTAVALNNVGRAVGFQTDSNGNKQAVYWRFSSQVGEPIANAIPLELPENGLESSATGINDENDNDAAGELISGWYTIEQNATTIKRAVIWRRDDAGIYGPVTLPLYRKTLPLCKPQSKEEIEALKEAGRNQRIKGICLETKQNLKPPPPGTSEEDSDDPTEPINAINLQDIYDANNPDIGGFDALNQIWGISTIPDCPDETTGEIIDYSTRDILDGVVIDCRDTQTEAIDVNDNGKIIGWSFDANDNRRPVYWAIRDGDRNGENYATLDLTTFVENETIQFNLSAAVHAIDKVNDTIIGTYLPNEEIEQQPFPVVWSNITANGFNTPDILLHSKGISSIARSISTTTFAGVTSAEFVVDENGTPQTNTQYGDYLAKLKADSVPFIWSESPRLTAIRTACLADNTSSPERCREAVIYGGNAVPTLQTNHSGELLAIGAFGDKEFVGYDFPTDNAAPNQTRAILYTTACSTQDINDLIIQPDNGNILVNQAIAISFRNLTENAIADTLKNIIASGTLDEAEKTFILTPRTVKLDLGVKVTANHEEIVVDQKHVYTIKISNDIKSDSYATCISVTFTTNVVITAGDERPGGLTYLGSSVNPTTTNANGSSHPITGSCDDGRSPIILKCKIARIDPGHTAIIRVTTRPRALLADRVVKAKASIISTEFITIEEGLTRGKTDTQPNNNSATQQTKINREGCFIATISFGSNLHPHVDFLRHIRDDTLDQTALGRWFIERYYDYSPSIADWLTEKNMLKSIIRVFLLMLILMLSYPTTTLIITSILLFSFIYPRNTRYKLS